jgi:hypothetical protein
MFQGVSQCVLAVSLLCFAEEKFVTIGAVVLTEITWGNVKKFRHLVSNSAQSIGIYFIILF